MVNKVKCKDCKFADSAFVKGYDGTGVFKTHICFEDITIGKIVDGEVDRECASFKVKEREAVHAT